MGPGACPIQQLLNRPGTDRFWSIPAIRRSPPQNDKKTDVPARCLFNFAEGDRTLKHLSRIAVPVLLLVALIAVAGCKKKPKPLPPVEQAPPAAAPAPTAQLTATPASISAGDQVVLSWKTTDATSVSIDGIGDVPTSGVKSVTPSASTSYHLVARGEGGTADATARVTVEQKPAVAVPSTTMSEEEEFKANVHDIFYDYDSADVRADAQSTLSQDAAYLNSHPNIKVVIGGYCDERGSNEYNLALG